MSIKSINVRVFFSILVTIVLWASAFVGIRAAIQDYPPIHLGAFRYLIASVILIPIACIKKVKLPNPKDCSYFYFQVFLGLRSIILP